MAPRRLAPPARADSEWPPAPAAELRRLLRLAALHGRGGASADPRQRFSLREPIAQRSPTTRPAPGATGASTVNVAWEPVRFAESCPPRTHGRLDCGRHHSGHSVHKVAHSAWRGRAPRAPVRRASVAVPVRLAVTRKSRLRASHKRNRRRSVRGHSVYRHAAHRFAERLTCGLTKDVVHGIARDNPGFGGFTGFYQARPAR